MFDGLTRLLNNVWEAQNTYLPGSVMEIECHQEVRIKEVLIVLACLFDSLVRRSTTRFSCLRFCSSP